jgi:hypothetical protein
MINDIKRAEGSVQDVDRIPDELKEVFRTAWEIPHAGADRHGRRARRVHRPEPVAQPVHGDARPSASSPRCTCTPGRGLKTTYYLRSRPATRINQTTTVAAKSTPTPPDAAVPDPKRSRRSSTRRRDLQEDVHRRRGGRVQPREPRSLRGMRLMASSTRYDRLCPAAPARALADEFESASPVGAPSDQHPRPRATT